MLLPIDSEHNAIFQCLPPFAAGESVAKGIRRSFSPDRGGPFRARFACGAVPRDAGRGLCASELGHGTKISVASATMMT